MTVKSDIEMIEKQEPYFFTRQKDSVQYYYEIIERWPYNDPCNGIKRLDAAYYLGRLHAMREGQNQ